MSSAVQANMMTPIAKPIITKTISILYANLAGNTSRNNRHKFGKRDCRDYLD